MKGPVKKVVPKKKKRFKKGLEDKLVGATVPVASAEEPSEPAEGNEEAAKLERQRRDDRVILLDQQLSADPLTTADGVLASALTFLPKDAASATDLQLRLQTLKTDRTALTQAVTKGGASAFDGAANKVADGVDKVKAALTAVGLATETERKDREAVVADLDQKRKADPLPRAAEVLAKAESYLPKGADAAKALGERRQALETNGKALGEATAKSRTEFDGAAKAVGEDVVELGKAVTAADAALTEERKRREEVLKKLDDEAKAATKNVAILEKGPFLAGAIPDQDALVKNFQEAAAAVGQEKDALLDATHDAFALKFDDARDKLDKFDKAFKGARVAEKNRRDAAIKERTDAVEEKEKEYGEIKKKSADVWPKDCPHDADFTGQAKKLKEYLTASLNFAATGFDKRMAAFPESLKALTDLNDTVGKEAEAARKVKDLRPKVDRQKKDALEKLGQISKPSAGLAGEATDAGKAVDLLLADKKKNVEALAKLEALGESAAAWNQLVSTYRGALQTSQTAAKKLGNFPEVQKRLLTLRADLEKDTFADFQKVKTAAGNLSEYTEAAKGLAEAFGEATTLYDSHREKQKFDRLQEAQFSKMFAELKAFKPATGDLQFTAARDKVKELEGLVTKAVADVDDYEKKLKPVEEKLAAVEKILPSGPLYQTLKERFGDARDNAKQNGYATVTKELDALKGALDAAKKFAQKVPALNNALAQVPKSDHGNLADDARIFLGREVQEAENALIKSWSFGDAEPALTGAAEAMAQYKTLAAALEKTRGAYASATVSAKAEGADVVAEILRDVKGKAHKKDWAGAGAGVTTLGEVATAVYAFQGVLKQAQDGQDKVDTTLADADFADVRKNAGAMYQKARSLGADNKAFDKTPYEQGTAALQALKPVYAAMTGLATPYLATRSLYEALGDRDLAQVRKNAAAMLLAARKPADDNTAVDATPYAALKSALVPLQAVYQAVGLYATKFLEVRKQYEHVVGLYSEEDGDEGRTTDAWLEEDFLNARKTADKNKAATASAYETARRDLTDLKVELDKEQAERRRKVKAAVDAAVQGDPTLTALAGQLYGGAGGGAAQAEEGALAVGGLYKSLGLDEMKKVLKGFDIDPTDATKQVAAKRVAALHGAVGGDGVKMLYERLGTPAGVGAAPNFNALIDPTTNPATKLLADIHEEFKEAPEALGDLTGAFDNKRDLLVSMVGGACKKDAKKVKALCDAFGGDDAGERATEMPKLKELVGADDLDATGKPKVGGRLGTLVEKRYGGDFGKLNTQLHAKVAAAHPNATTRKKLWKAASRFEEKPQDKSLIDEADFDKKGCGDMRVDHFLERHFGAHFDFAKADFENTLFPNDKTKADIKAALQSALDQVAAEPDVDINGVWADNERNVKEYVIDGMRIKIGIKKYAGKAKPTVDQFFPVAGAGHETADPDTTVVMYTSTEMATLSEAVKKPAVVT